MTDRTTRLYLGRRDRDRSVVVAYRDPGHREWTLLPHHLWNTHHGFDWGQPGRGSTDLARSLLVDALGEHATCHPCRGAGWETDGALCWDCLGTGLNRLTRHPHHQGVAALTTRLPTDQWEINGRMVLSAAGLTPNPPWECPTCRTVLPIDHPCPHCDTRSDQR